jgi:hypothetical protein
MKSAVRRVSRLEDRFAPAQGQQIVVSLYDAGCKLALDQHTCVQILATPGTSIQRAPLVSRTLPTFLMA